jgi:hypothetical protein
MQARKNLEMSGSVISDSTGGKATQQHCCRPFLHPAAGRSGLGLRYLWQELTANDLLNDIRG